MTRTANIGHWFLLTPLFVESMWLGHVTFADYVLGQAFGFRRAYPSSYWLDVLSGLFIYLLGFFAASTVLLDHRWSKQVSAVFCSLAIVFFSVRALSAQSRDWWFESESCFLPVVLLGYLAFSWFGSRLDSHKVGQLS
jgi:hypothetical protein